MPRLPRLHVPGGFYHVILRGNHRENLFGTDIDRDKLNEIVADALIHFDARLHAFCWMTNHLHGCIQIGVQPLGQVMQRIAMKYSRYRHRLLHTRGHLFERRYRARLVDTDAYFITLLRYIHLNPVKAGMVVSPNQYPWSSHRAYLGEETLPWLTQEFALSLLGKTVESARAAYRLIFAQSLYASEDHAIEAGHPDDARVLDDDSFLENLPDTPFVPRNPRTLAQLVDELCSRREVSVLALKSSAKDRALSVVRAEIARQAVEGRIASLSQVARYLNRGPASLGKLLKRHTKPNG